MSVAETGGALIVLDPLPDCILRMEACDAHCWNEQGMEVPKGHKGARRVPSTEEMLKGVYDAIASWRPTDHGYSKSHRDPRVLLRYILGACGRKYPYECIRQVLYELG